MKFFNGHDTKRIDSMEPIAIQRLFSKLEGEHWIEITPGDEYVVYFEKVSNKYKRSRNHRRVVVQGFTEGPFEDVIVKYLDSLRIGRIHPHGLVTYELLEQLAAVDNPGAKDALIKTRME